MSLKKKFKYVYAVSGCIIAVALITSIFLSIKGMGVFTDTLDSNDKAMNLCNSITQERKLLKVYLQDEQPFVIELLDNTRQNTKNILTQLYTNNNNLNEDQYILIQSINNFYNSYEDIYANIMKMDTKSEEYKVEIDKCYKVQQYLEEYSKDFESLTVSIGNTYYNSQKKLFYLIPTICIIVASVVIILFMWLKYFISKKIVEPVLNLSDEAKKISMNDFSGEDLKVEGDDEISMLIKEFVEMKHSTKNYIEMLKEKHKVEQQLERMRFEMLKNQINPHFLFNTLNLIAGTAQIEDAATTEKMIITLSRLFRYNLKTQTSIMPLEQELKVVSDYMYLQQMRFGQRIKYICDADDKCRDELVPSFVLQPLVENAIIHGLSHSSKGGIIYVRCFMKDGKMWLSVADTGLGMDRERLENVRRCVDDIFKEETQDIKSEDFNKQEKDEISSNEIERKTVGVGVGNIAHRVKEMYNDSGMKIYSVKEHGTVVQVYFQCEK